MRRVISLYLPTFQTDRLRHQKPGVYPPKNALVTTYKKGSRYLLHSVDRTAYHMGLRVQQPLAEARALVPGLAIEEYNVEADERALQAYAEECLKKYSPLVAIDGPNSLSLDIAGCDHLYGDEKKLADHLLEFFKYSGYSASLGLSDTYAGAYALAHFGRTRCTIAAKGGNKEALSALPIAALRLSEEISEGLAQLGFHQIHQLYNVARAPLARRFGTMLLSRYDQAFGCDVEVMTPITLPIMPSVKCHFSEPVTHRPFMEKALRELVTRLCQKLCFAGMGAHKIDIVAGRVDNTYQAQRVGTSRATRDVLQLTKLLIEKITAFNVGFGLETLSLQVPLVSQLGAEQCVSGLGKNPSETMGNLIDVLSNRLGERRVYRCEPLESDVPERSYRRVKAASKKTSDLLLAPLPNPTRLLPFPQMVHALAMLPDHAPHFFTWRNRHHRIVRADGPERICGEWWKKTEERQVVRDYFRVEDDEGQRFWLFRYGNGEDASTGSYKWYLHGFFA